MVEALCTVSFPGIHQENLNGTLGGWLVRDLFVIYNRSTLDAIVASSVLTSLTCASGLLGSTNRALDKCVTKTDQFAITF